MRDVVGSEMEADWDGERDAAAWSGEMMKAFDPTGASGAWAAPYSFIDQADDYVRVLDQLGIPAATILGFSTGGAIAQISMVRHPRRVISAVLCASGYNPDTIGDGTLEGVAVQMAEDFQARMARAPPLTPDSTEELFIRNKLITLGTMMDFPDGEEEKDPRAADLIARAKADWAHGWWDKTGAGNPRSALAYSQWRKDGGLEEHLEALKHNAVPCLIVHGRRDPIIKYEDHAEALAAGTGSSTLLTHEHGHILGPADSQEKLLDEIAEFIKSHPAAAPHPK